MLPADMPFHKEDVSVVLKAAELESTDQIQQLYDTIVRSRS
jgi:hypothetical protein